MRVKLFGCYIDNLSMEEVLERIDEFIKSERPHQNVVVNANKIVLARKDSQLRNIINACDLIGVDGVPVIWASKVLGRPLKERINGTDLMERLITRAYEKGYKLYFLGAKEEIVKRVVEKYKGYYPRLQMVGFRNGYWNTEEEERIVDDIRDAKPDILFIGFSSPKKEVFLRKYSERMGVPFAMGVGGSFDAVAGLTKRAPVWMQKNGLEWLFRFFQEPKRLWKRYLIGNSIFLWLFLKEFVKIKILRKKSDYD